MVEEMKNSGLSADKLRDIVNKSKDPKTGKTNIISVGLLIRKEVNKLPRNGRDLQNMPGGGDLCRSPFMVCKRLDQSKPKVKIRFGPQEFTSPPGVPGKEEPAVLPGVRIEF